MTQWVDFRNFHLGLRCARVQVDQEVHGLAATQPRPDRGPVTYYGLQKYGRSDA